MWENGKVTNLSKVQNKMDNLFLNKWNKLTGPKCIMNPKETLISPELFSWKGCPTNTITKNPVFVWEHKLKQNGKNDT